MKISDELYIVGGGANGIGLTDRYDSNIYLIQGGDQLALVDAGACVGGAEYLLSNVEADGFGRQQIGYLFLTHCHADHSGGSAELREKTGLRVCISQAEADVLRKGDEAASGLNEARADGLYPRNYRFRPCEVDIELTDAQTIHVGYLAVTAIHVPGHSPGSMCYLFRGKDAMYLLTGDTVFCTGRISLLNCRGSSLSAYRTNLKKLHGLGVDALMPGHFGFCMRYGQDHIDKAVEAMRHIAPPPNI